MISAAPAAPCPLCRSSTTVSEPLLLRLDAMQEIAFFSQPKICNFGAAVVIPFVESDLRKSSLRVIEKAKELCNSYYDSDFNQEYQNKRGGRVKLQSILMPVSEYDHSEKGDALYAMELSLALEKLTNEKVLHLHKVFGILIRFCCMEMEFMVKLWSLELFMIYLLVE